jgi:glucose-6-phosphate 1-dehydrogenase
MRFAMSRTWASPARNGLGFARRLHYVHGDLNTPADFEALGTRLRQLEADRGQPANRLYYLSVAPNYFETALTNHAGAGLTEDSPGWRRVVIEKPFGNDLETARKLNLCVGRVFDENQVYRCRPLPGQRDSAEPAGAAVRQRDIRASLELKFHR